MRLKSEREELQLLLRSRFPIIVVETAEERRFLDLIENVANAAAYAAHADHQPLETRHLLEELRSTRPLAVVRAEKVADLREWARERTVPTD